MTEKAKVTNLIPKPLQRAFYAGLSAGGFSFVFGVPAEYTPRVIVAGACYSLFLSWGELGKRPRQKRGRQILLNHAKGSTPIDLEFSTSQGGYIARETWGNRVNRWVYGKDNNRQVKPIMEVHRPTELDEFTFISQGIELREKHVMLFLKSAWRNKQYGKGLSERRWVRKFSQRLDWYKELSPAWFYAMRQLLVNAHGSPVINHKHTIIIGSNQWLSLANEPHLTISLLKWFESERRKSC